MMYDSYPPQLLSPTDVQAPQRTRRLHQIGIDEKPDPEFDDFAHRIAELTGTPYALVNFIGEDHQYLGGLHVSPNAPPNEIVSMVESNRILPPDYGYCPHVVTRRKALVLDDVCDYPRFAGNPVVDEIGLRSYLGAPLIDRTGVALGTICVVDLYPRPWGRDGLETIKSFAAELMTRIEQREARVH